MVLRHAGGEVGSGEVAGVGLAGSPLHEEAVRQPGEDGVQRDGVGCAQAAAAVVAAGIEAGGQSFSMPQYWRLASSQAAASRAWAGRLVNRATVSGWRPVVARRKRAAWAAKGKPTSSAVTGRVTSVRVVVRPLFRSVRSSRRTSPVAGGKKGRRDRESRARYWPARWDDCL